MLEVCLIGTGGSIPKPERWLASALLRHNGSSVVIDCGEGTQLALKSAGYPAGRIALILITHFHADHVSGLPGLLLAMSNEGRLDPVTIAGPRGLRHVVESLCVIAGNLPFQVNVLELPSEHFELPPEYPIYGSPLASPFINLASNSTISSPVTGFAVDIELASASFAYKLKFFEKIKLS